MDTNNDDQDLAETYGPAAPFSEHQRGERIRYQIDRYTYTGTIIWIAAAGNQTLSLLKLPGLC